MMPCICVMLFLNSRSCVTRNYTHFEELHELVIDAQGHHSGILVIRTDNDPRRDLKAPGIVKAINRLLASGIPIEDQYIILNHWR